MHIIFFGPGEPEFFKDIPLPYSIIILVPSPFGVATYFMYSALMLS